VRVLRDYQGLAVRLTDERHRHILQHPEMVGLDDEIQHALAAPGSVVESVSDAETRLYYRHVASTIVGPKELCVVVKVRPGDAFVITAYLTDQLKKGRLLWPTGV
jgi:hypothetical protein